MACFWTRDDELGAWVPTQLVEGEPGGTVLPAGVEAHAFRDAMDRPAWALLVQPGHPVRVNGATLRTGIRVLRDRDAIVAGAGRLLFFSTERPPERVEIPVERVGSRCARCNTPFKAGSMAVSCPGCASWYHAIDSGPEPLPCWRHQPGCSVCRRDTDAAYAWTPANL